MLKSMLIAGCGGFLGTCARFLFNRLGALWFASSTFPVATFAVNVIGCFLFGLFSGMLEHRQMLSGAQATLLVTGFCGGLTTFSTFAGETCALGGKEGALPAILYIGASIAAGLLAVWGGKAITA